MDKQLENWMIMYNFINRHMNYIENNSRFTKEVMNRVYYLLYVIERKLFIHCEHNIVDDYIDILPEKSQQIKYCLKCSLTF